jgi:uncharacterized damage-inducible protein DinB
MFRRVNDFEKTWQYEAEGTLKVFNAIDSSVLTKKLHPQVRNMSVLAWHITTTLYEMLNLAGLQLEPILFPGDEPGSKQFILDSYEKLSGEVITQVKQHWSDSQLDDMVDMYGEKWSKGQVLSILIDHQAHHRGQLTVLLRMTGSKVPGIYGPANEEWSAMGMEPMK